MNYVVVEGRHPGERGPKNVNVTLSLLHNYLSQINDAFLLDLHADNCAGQNKNGTVLAYLAWRVMRRLNQRVRLSFMVAGHTKCQCDANFGCIKRFLRTRDAYTPRQLVDAVRCSSSHNRGLFVHDPAAPDSQIKLVNWSYFLGRTFKKVRGISECHVFEFSCEKPGWVRMKNYSTTVEEQAKEVRILLEQMEGQRLGSPFEGSESTLVDLPLPQSRSAYIRDSVACSVPAHLRDEFLGSCGAEEVAAVQLAAAGSAEGIGDDS